MPIRERIAHGFDQWIYRSQKSALSQYGDPLTTSLGLAVGIGVIEGVECVILGHDPSVRAGAFNPLWQKPVCVVWRSLEKTACPMCNLSQRLGRDLGGQGRWRWQRPEQVAEAAIQRDLPDHFAESGRLFYDIRTVENAHTHCVGRVWCCHRRWCLSARHERLQHYGKKPSHGALGAPPLVKMATGEDANGEDLGGADMHTQISGLGDYLAQDLDGRHPLMPRGGVAFESGASSDPSRARNLKNRYTTPRRHAGLSFERPQNTLRHSRSGDAA